MKKYIFKLEVETNQASDSSVGTRKATIKAICGAVGQGSGLGLSLPGDNGEYGRVVSVRLTGDSVTE